MIERLKRKHRSFETKLDEADNNINRDNNIEEGIKKYVIWVNQLFIMQLKKKQDKIT